MNNLKKHHLIRRQNLNEADYFQSILQESYRLNLLSAIELESIQVQCLQLLAKQIQRYTGGDSSSVKEETAQKIMQSIFYVIGCSLKPFSEPDSCVEVLCHKSLSELFQQGKKLIAEQLDTAKQLLANIQNDGFITENQAYYDTIQEGIPPFFLVYDVQFAAHEIPASIDYPIFKDKMDLVGIEYIYNYLKTLSLENKFLNLFPTAAINRLLESFHNHYKDLLINIFGLVLTNALGCVLVNNPITQLHIGSAERESLQKQFVNLPQHELKNYLHQAVLKLYKELEISDPLLQEHMSELISDLSITLNNALENSKLDSLFVSFKENDLQSFIFEEGNKMNDELFRSIVDEIRDCRYISDKITIIQKEVHSMRDFIDILGSYCIFDDEYNAVFQSLGDTELALLIKLLPTDNILDPDIHFSENEKEWHDRLRSFLDQKDLLSQSKLSKLSENILFHNV